MPHRIAPSYWTVPHSGTKVLLQFAIVIQIQTFEEVTNTRFLAVWGDIIYRGVENIHMLLTIGGHSDGSMLPLNTTDGV